ncbi:hypothetical protein RI129_010545 [Pyrocoelia pectoralis]|uniref:Uncharacterized protein n=1 Tax=Pyrocoelia pectoralis TaxID=417401 RepID=A0AAN7V9G2_9COLE
MLQELLKFINYWYFRYLLITELYMVEKWERVMIHIVLLIIFTIIGLFNWIVVLGAIGYFVGPVINDNIKRQVMYS